MYNIYKKDKKGGIIMYGMHGKAIVKRGISKNIAVMLVAAEPISKFVNNHPAFKILALSFLILIGVSLIAEGLEFHIPKGYIYFSMAFSLLVNFVQMKIGKRNVTPVKTHEHYLPAEPEIKKDVVS